MVAAELRTVVRPAPSVDVVNSVVVLVTGADVVAGVEVSFVVCVFEEELEVGVGVFDADEEVMGGVEEESVDVEDDVVGVGVSDDEVSLVVGVGVTVVVVVVGVSEVESCVVVVVVVTAVSSVDVGVGVGVSDVVSSSVTLRS